MSHQFFQSRRQDESLPLETRITEAVRDMLRPLGLADNPTEFASLLDRELKRVVARNVIDEIARSVSFAGARVLDLGAGLGTLSIEAAMRGAKVTAVEPGPELCALAAERLQGIGEALCVSGERLPFEDGEFAIVLSHQVLEHVEHPIAYLREAFRVLQPGGTLYLSCENYLRFVEPHYRIFWLPLMPKWLGAIYLRLRNRPTDFLKHSITYTTTPWVLHMLKQCGFQDAAVPRVRRKLGKLGALAELLVWGRHMRGALTSGTSVLMVRPR